MKKQNYKQDLFGLKICSRDSVEMFYPKTRDSDQAVMKCNRSGVIFLSESKKNKNDYKNKRGHAKLSSDSTQDGIVNREIFMNSFFKQRDVQRRASFIEPLVENKRWIDIGTGSGGILDELSKTARIINGIELQDDLREILNERGYDTYETVYDLPPNKLYDVVSMFHVFEHLVNPIDDLKQIFSKLDVGGKIVIEIPHARDFLLSILECESFKRRHFWSEHLILHTRYSIECFLRSVGFNNIVTKGIQRYPLSNHLHWLSKNKPGGHIKWKFLETDNLDAEYELLLSSLDVTDTLMIIGEKS